MTTRQRTYVSGRIPAKYEVTQDGFQLVGGRQKFNRALYGKLIGGSRFRALAGDLPEILLSLPGDGGRAMFGLLSEHSSKWVHDMEEVCAQYDAGEMKYTIKDTLLGEGRMQLSVLPLVNEAGIVIRITMDKPLEGLRFLFAYGGASGQRHNRSFDAGYIHHDVLQFTPSRCEGNEILTGTRIFSLRSPGLKEGSICGRTTFGNEFFLGEAAHVEQGPLSLSARGHLGPHVAVQTVELTRTGFEGYVVLHYEAGTGCELGADEAETLYLDSISELRHIAERVSVNTPEPIFNAAVKTACIATNAIWLPPVFAHGAWSWNNPLMGWRSMYGPIVFGWHDRVQTQARFFASYQITTPTPERKPAPDPNYHLSRQSQDSVFVSEGMMPYKPPKLSSDAYRAAIEQGGVSAIEHRVQYNMQEVFMDEILYEYDWTGDLSFAKEMFPVLRRHLLWEKRCFDPDQDGLYENFANFWASDGIYYSGAGCSLASAYAYRANAAAAKMALRLGEDPSPFLTEAALIRQAVNQWLWLPDQGRLAECRDAYGERLIHPEVSLPTLVHTAESGILDDFQIYQMMRYTKTALERVSVDDCDGELVWTSNWVPYVWSVRELDYADILHASLAYYRIGCVEEAYKLLLGATVDSTCNNVSPGAFMCLYEGKSVDFADTVSMFDRALVEGLFGIRRSMHDGKMTVTPGFPLDWNTASIKTPDVEYQYSSCEGLETMLIRSSRECEMEIRLRAKRNTVKVIKVDGIEAAYQLEPGIGHSYIVVAVKTCAETTLTVEYGPEHMAQLNIPSFAVSGATLTLGDSAVKVLDVMDPQKVLLSQVRSEDGGFSCVLAACKGHHTFFVLIQDGVMKYWKPVDLEITPPLEPTQPKLDIEAGMFSFRLRNYTQQAAALVIEYDEQFTQVDLPPLGLTEPIHYAIKQLNTLLPGKITFDVKVRQGGFPDFSIEVENWDLWRAKPHLQIHPNQVKHVHMDDWFNDSVSNLFRREYRSPRSPYCSLQVPLHLYPSDWCVTAPQGMELIDDHYLRSLVGDEQILQTEAGISFRQVSQQESPNAAFVSHWEAFPTSIEIPVNDQGRRLYLLLTGYTNQMQIGVPNGVIEIVYEDGTSESLVLTFPENFRSLEKGPESERIKDQTCYGTAQIQWVRVGSVMPEASSSEQKHSLRYLYGQIIDIVIEPKPLAYVKVRAVANDVMIGLMGITLIK